MASFALRSMASSLSPFTRTNINITVLELSSKASTKLPRTSSAALTTRRSRPRRQRRTRNCAAAALEAFAMRWRRRRQAGNYEFAAIISMVAAIVLFPHIRSHMISRFSSLGLLCRCIALCRTSTSNVPLLPIVSSAPPPRFRDRIEMYTSRSISRQWDDQHVSLCAVLDLVRMSNDTDVVRCRKIEMVT